MHFFLSSLSPGHTGVFSHNGIERPDKHFRATTNLFPKAITVSFWRMHFSSGAPAHVSSSQMLLQLWRKSHGGALPFPPASRLSAHTRLQLQLAWAAQALFWRGQLWMPMAVWYFNKAWVYIKPCTPFSAKFHTCLEEAAELERINGALDYLQSYRGRRMPWHQLKTLLTTALCRLGCALSSPPFFPTPSFFRLSAGWEL